MYLYKESQSAPWMYLFVLVFILPFVFDPELWSDSPLLLPALLAFGVSAFSLFTPLRTSVDDKRLLLRFGLGLFRKTILRSDIVSAAPARHKWYHGWGIRIIGWKTWVFNIKGFDLVEIKTKKGMTYRVGTASPDELVRILSS